MVECVTQAEVLASRAQTPTLTTSIHLPLVYFQFLLLSISAIVTLQRLLVDRASLDLKPVVVQQYIYSAYLLDDLMTHTGGQMGSKANHTTVSFSQHH